MSKTIDKVPRSVRSRGRSKRSGGYLVACAPEGFIADICEFMDAESCSQRYMFVSRLKDGPIVNLRLQPPVSSVDRHDVQLVCDEVRVCVSLGASVCGSKGRDGQELYPSLVAILHDDACHLRRFAAARAGASDFAASLAHPRTCRFELCHSCSHMPHLGWRFKVLPECVKHVRDSQICFDNALEHT